MTLPLVNALDRLQEATIESGGKTWRVRRGHRLRASADAPRRPDAAAAGARYFATNGRLARLTKAAGTPTP